MRNRLIVLFTGLTLLVIAAGCILPGPEPRGDRHRREPGREREHERERDHDRGHEERH